MHNSNLSRQSFSFEFVGILRAKDGCESQARYRPLAAGAHEMKGPDRGGSIRAEC